MYEDNDIQDPNELTPVEGFVHAVFGPVIWLAGIGIAIVIFMFLWPLFLAAGIIIGLYMLGEVSGFNKGFRKGLEGESE